MTQRTQRPVHRLRAAGAAHRWRDPCPRGRAAQIDATVAEDPFIRERAARCEVIGFVPSEWAPGFGELR